MMTASWGDTLISLYNHYDKHKSNPAVPEPRPSSITSMVPTPLPISHPPKQPPQPFGMALGESAITGPIPFPFHSECIPIGEPLWSSHWNDASQPIIRINMSEMCKLLTNSKRPLSDFHFYIYRQFTSRTNVGFSRFLDLNGWDFVFDQGTTRTNATRVEVRTMTDCPLDVTKLVYETGAEYLSIRITKFPKSLLRMNESFVQLVAAIPSPANWAASLVKGTRLTKDHVLSAIKASFKGTAADDEIQTASVDYSLRCPLGFMRMNWPGRSILCTHIQSFDLVYFLEVYLMKVERKCPICNARICLEDLMVDELFWNIVQNSSSEVESVRMNENAEWKVQEAREVHWKCNLNDQSVMNLEEYTCKQQPEVVDLT